MASAAAQPLLAGAAAQIPDQRRAWGGYKSQGVPVSLRTENRDSFNTSGWKGKCTLLCFRLKRMLTARVGAVVPLLLAPKLAKIEFVGWSFSFQLLGAFKNKN